MRIKKFASIPIAALALMAIPVAAPASTVSTPDIEITEVPTPFGGTYTVTNNTAGSYLMAFGVSNTDSTAYLSDNGALDINGCQSGWCYDATTVTAENWDSTIAYYDGDSETLADLFGSFYSNVEQGEDTIHWYRAVDGALGPGDTSSDFFAFGAEGLHSMALGVLSGSGDVTIFQNQQVSTVPIPAAVWLLGSALLGMFGVARRKSA
ncbi:MAG TPA: VPLPA-CTERM sorting domain-containing protein [Chromatiales bacterium]|nr:VPLPA-CTERM sorting domain-containing protein [Chromatiales bacterium]